MGNVWKERRCVLGEGGGAEKLAVATQKEIVAVL